MGGPACLEVRIAHGSLGANPRSAAAADPRVNDRCRVSREKLAVEARPAGVARQPTVIIRRQQLIGQVPGPADIYKRTDIPPHFGHRGLFALVHGGYFLHIIFSFGWLGSRVVSVLDSDAEGPGSNRSRDAVG